MATNMINKLFLVQNVFLCPLLNTGNIKKENVIIIIPDSPAAVCQKFFPKFVTTVPNTLVKVLKNNKNIGKSLSLYDFKTITSINTSYMLRFQHFLFQKHQKTFQIKQ